MTQHNEKLGIGDRDLISRVFWGAVHGIVAIINLIKPGQINNEQGFSSYIEDVDLDKRV